MPLHKAPRTYASEHDAEGWLAAERRKIDLGTWGAVERSDGVTLRRYADRWIEQRALRTRTQSLYESMLERLILPELGDAKLTAHAGASARVARRARHQAPTRNAHAYALLHAICATAVADELLDANPCRIRAAMQTKRRRSIDDAHARPARRPGRGDAGRTVRECAARRVVRAALGRPRSCAGVT